MNLIKNTTKNKLNLAVNKSNKSVKLIRKTTALIHCAVESV